MKNTGFELSPVFFILYIYHLPNEENYERKESNSGR